MIEKRYKQKFTKVRSSRWWLIPKVGMLLFGIITIAWFWFSIIAIIIGIIFIMGSSDIAWKRNGAILALAAGVSTFLIEHLSSVALYIVLGILLVLLPELIFLFTHLYRILLIKAGKTPKFQAFSLTFLSNKISSYTKLTIKILAIAMPVFLWSLVSIQPAVLLDNNTNCLWINAPSTVKIGESMDITVQAWDSFERLSSNYDGTVEFSIKSYDLSTYEVINAPNVQLPPSYSFTGQILSQGMVPGYEIKDGKDNGMHRFNTIINTPGIHYILVSDSKTKNTYYSNPIIVDNFTKSDPLIVWGDIHSHSMLSDGSGSPEHSFYYARNIACLDYFSLTDHGEHLNWFGLTQNGGNLFTTLETATNFAYEPYKFVTFQGLEWTTNYVSSLDINFGHYTCIFSGTHLPHVAANTIKSPSVLWGKLDEFTLATGDRVLALPHHTVRNQFIQDWTYINPKYVKLAEVTSVHGESLFEQRHPLSYRGAVDPPPEYVKGSSIVDAFNMGKRMVLYASSDNHDGHPGHSLSHTDAYIGHQWPFSIWYARNGHPYPGGITAVHALNLTRKAVFDGLENQRIYANSDHGRPILAFSVNGTTVGDGSTLVAQTKNDHRKIEVFLAQDGSPIALKNTAATVSPNWSPNWLVSIEIIKNGELLWTQLVSDPVSKFDYIDTTPIQGASYEHCCLKKDDGNYYINQYSDNPIDPTSLHTNGFDYYLIRVVGSNGRTSYIGPIWVEYLT